MNNDENSPDYTRWPATGFPPTGGYYDEDGQWVTASGANRISKFDPDTARQSAAEQSGDASLVRPTKDDSE